LIYLCACASRYAHVHEQARAGRAQSDDSIDSKYCGADTETKSSDSSDYYGFSSASRKATCDRQCGGVVPSSTKRNSLLRAIAVLPRASQARASPDACLGSSQSPAPGQGSASTFAGSEATRTAPPCPGPSVDRGLRRLLDPVGTHRTEREGSEHPPGLTRVSRRSS